MPAVGDQHKSNGPATANPFEDSKPQTTQYTAAEIATLQARLDKQLGPEFISSRPGASGQKVHYLAGEKVINLANEVFGFNGWSSGIQNIQIDFVDENPQTGKISLGLSVIVRVTLKDGTYHEDIGYGNIENCKGKAAAFQKAKKEGTTDALKRALRTFGKVLGNCIYDKDFLGKVTKMKVGKGKWDENDLHRHSDFALVKKEEAGGPGENRVNTNAAHILSTTDPVPNLDEGFDITDFDDAEFGDEEFGDPDQIVLPEVVPSRKSRPPVGFQHEMGPPARNGNTTPSRALNARPVAVPPAASRGVLFPQSSDNIPPQRTAGPPGANRAVQMNRPPPDQAHPHDQQQNPNDIHHSSPGFPSQQFAPQHTNAPNQQQQNGPPRTIAFYSARAANNIDGDNNLTVSVNAVPKFDPHAESPSIRKTAGVDHRKSAPLPRDVVVKEPGGRDFIDPRSDQARRLGIPGQVATSPAGKSAASGMGTSAYRPLSRRATELTSNAAGAGGQGMPGGVDRVLTAAKRPPLGDMSNVQHQQQHQQQQHNVTAVTGDGGDAKRMKIAGPGAQPLPGQKQVVGTGPENVALGAPG